MLIPRASNRTDQVIIMASCAEMIGVSNLKEGLLIH
jgi:hypothetical protein